VRKTLALLLALLPAGALGFELPTGKEFTNSVGMKLVRIELGEFVMGCGERPPENEEEWRTRDWDESPAHPVKITRSFFMSVCEVTNAQYEQFDPGHRKLRAVSACPRRTTSP
jgi:sulfatase modifying factor 1